MKYKYITEEQYDLMPILGLNINQIREQGDRILEGDFNIVIQEPIEEIEEFIKECEYRLTYLDPDLGGLSYLEYEEVKGYKEQAQTLCNYMKLVQE